MKKEFFMFIFLSLIFLNIIFVAAQDNSQNPLAAEIATETNPDTIGATSSEETEEKPEFNVDPGITPDNPFYFFDNLVESVSVGNDPEKALEMKEEKIAEARVMIEEGKTEEAGMVLDKALQYGDIIEKEVSPELKREIQERSQTVQYVLEDLRDKTENIEIKEKFDKNLEKEKKIESAAELVSKISELCDALAKLDPLQYADTCRPKGNSPKWQKEKDKELTKEQEEQAEVFIEKLSLCFKNPENCDCRGMGIQKFEEFCLEKSKLAVKCKEGDKETCKELENSDPRELLPSYLNSAFKKTEEGFIDAKYNLYMPEECGKVKAKNPEDCSKIMFESDSPPECIKKNAKTPEECKQIMFEIYTPQECKDLINNADAPRLCAKKMFEQRASQECIDAGITGEGKGDEKKCKELMQEEKSKPSYKPKFNKDCNSFSDSNEKMKCYEEFYNNAQIQFNDDFVQREVKGAESNGRNFAASMGAKNPDNPCPDGFCDKWETEHPRDCPQDCGGSVCQNNEQIENLKQECKNKGQDAVVENRGGCPWVVCVGGERIEQIGRAEQAGRTEQVGKEGFQPSQGGQKCPDNVCDDYEKMNPYACPEDCGGQRVVQEPQQQPSQPQNRIDQPQAGCQGIPPNCGENNPAAFCENGNWKCPPNYQEQPKEVQEPEQPQIQQPEAQEPSQEIVQQPQKQVQQTEPAQVTGGAITGKIIASIYGDDNSRSGDSFLDYWFGR